MQHTDPAQFRSGQQPGPAAPPDFDPDHPDAEILEAFANHRLLKMWAYVQQDMAGAPGWPQHDLDRIDAELQRLEQHVLENFATTPAAAAAQLLITLSELDLFQDRSFDRGLAEQGILPFYHQRDQLGFDEPTKRLVEMVRTLLEMEWNRALEAYEGEQEACRLWRAADNLATAEQDRLKEAGQSSSPVLAGLIALRTSIEDQMQGECIRRLLRTLAPYLGAYQRKAAIAIEHDMAAEAAPWLLRDVNFLMGRFDPVTTRRDARAE